MANNENGNNVTTATITVVPDTVTGKVVLPVADFNANVTSGNAPLSVQFTDLSQNAASSRWDFGDGASSTEKNPTHTYSAEGTYNVNLKVSNSNGIALKLATINVLTINVLKATGPYAYITSYYNNTVSVIDVATDTIIATVPVGIQPMGVAATLDGKKVYVTNLGQHCFK